MLRIAFIAVTLVLFTLSVGAQQMPGRFSDADPGGHKKQFPGEQNQKVDAEISRLNALVIAQKEKIALLEEKVKLLEADLKKAKGGQK
ncbi:MAG: hypothetical protein HYY65_05070 [Candidatus Tectomicrobia bacterium]|uniref:YbgF trimerisation domain-containing protein n=1 Tax=Tectimicrobiota bacterium TaxID=2528274 RepID=A0A932GNW0_UNCTE|nr:hypothetical protein [Candidatus Tectomicrobia bacterium]